MKKEFGSKRFYEVIGQAYEKHRHQTKVSPSWLATIAMTEIGFGRDLHELGWIGCHLYLRQIARSFCNKKFDPIESINGDDLFPETLQHRYPIRPSNNDEEPFYVLLDNLTQSDLDYNVLRLRKDGSARLKHADALEAWGRSRKGVA